MSAARDRLDVADLERYDSLFIAPHGDDVALGCPARVLGEAERGRRILVLALFEPVGSDTPAPGGFGRRDRPGCEARSDRSIGSARQHPARERRGAGSKPESA